MAEDYVPPEIFPPAMLKRPRKGTTKHARRERGAFAEQLLGEIGSSRRDPQHAVLEAYCLMARGDKKSVDAAFDTLSEVLNRDQDNAPATLALASCFELQNLPAKTKVQLKRLAKLPHRAAEADAFEAAWLASAYAFFESGRHDQAQELCQRCLQHNKSCAGAWELMGMICEREATADAAECYENAWRCVGNSDPSVGFKLAFVLFKAGQMVMCVDVCRAVLDKHRVKIEKDMVRRAQFAAAQFSLALFAAQVLSVQFLRRGNCSARNPPYRRATPLQVIISEFGGRSARSGGAEERRRRGGFRGCRTSTRTRFSSALQGASSSRRSSTRTRVAARSSSTSSRARAFSRVRRGLAPELLVLGLALRADAAATLRPRPPCARASASFLARGGFEHHGGHTEALCLRVVCELMSADEYQQTAVARLGGRVAPTLDVRVHGPFYAVLQASPSPEHLAPRAILGAQFQFAKNTRNSPPHTPRCGGATYRACCTCNTSADGRVRRVFSPLHATRSPCRTAWTYPCHPLCALWCAWARTRPRARLGPARAGRFSPATASAESKRARLLRLRARSARGRDAAAGRAGARRLSG